MHIQEAEEKTYLVKYRLPNEEGRNPRKVTVQAKSQADAKRAAQATIPNAKIIGGPKQLDEGALDFVGRVGKFASRCAGRLCHAYAKTKVNRKSGTISQVRKQLTRDIARGLGDKLMSAGGADKPIRKRVIRTKRRK